jgi:hypothetical protein
MQVLGTVRYMPCVFRVSGLVLSLRRRCRAIGNKTLHAAGGWDVGISRRGCTTTTTHARFKDQGFQAQNSVFLRKVPPWASLGKDLSGPAMIASEDDFYF